MKDTCPTRRSSDLLVPVDSPMSNVGMIARQFLPKGARVLPITAEAAADYRAAGKAADARLADLQWPPDLVWLGVGEDGHAASIFPVPDLEEALEGPKTRRALGVLPDPMPADPHTRQASVRARVFQSVYISVVHGHFKQKKN